MIIQKQTFSMNISSYNLGEQNTCSVIYCLFV